MAGANPQLQQLLAKQDRAKGIEAEILGITETLDNMPGKPGVKGPLVDREGFPRADVDIHEVRNLRHRLAYLQTDHVNLMKEIEREMIAFYQGNKGGVAGHKLETEPHGPRAAVSQSESAAAAHQPLPASSPSPPALVPFALIDQIFPASPAESAGLRLGDRVVSFGHVTKDVVQSQGMTVLAGVVRNYENRALTVRVISEGEQGVREVSLTPSSWSGQGLLGCHLAPLS